MRALLVLFLIFSIYGISFSQSKKKQIELLNHRVDSLKQILLFERQKSTDRNRAFVDNLNNLELEISTLKKDNETLKIEINHKDYFINKQKKQIDSLSLLIENERKNYNLFHQAFWQLEKKNNFKQDQSISYNLKLYVDNKELILIPIEMDWFPDNGFNYSYEDKDTLNFYSNKLEFIIVDTYYSYQYFFNDPNHITIELYTFSPNYYDPNFSSNCPVSDAELIGSQNWIIKMEKLNNGLWNRVDTININVMDKKKLIGKSMPINSDQLNNLSIQKAVNELNSIFKKEIEFKVQNALNIVDLNQIPILVRMFNNNSWNKITNLGSFTGDDIYFLHLVDLDYLFFIYNSEQFLIPLKTQSYFNDKTETGKSLTKGKLIFEGSGFIITNNWTSAGLSNGYLGEVEVKFKNQILQVIPIRSY
jgi:hypothetical protein